MENTKKKLPFGFYVCCLTYSFERLAYYAANGDLRFSSQPLQQTVVLDLTNPLVLQ